MSNKQQHIHKFKRVIIGGTSIEKDPETGRKRLVSKPGTPYYRCIIPGCNSRYLIDDMEGRESICWGCGGIVAFSTSMRTLAKPRHFQCRKKRKEEEIEMESFSI
jgi:hypothetical protein